MQVRSARVVLFGETDVEIGAERLRDVLTEVVAQALPRDPANDLARI